MNRAHCTEQRRPTMETTATITQRRQQRAFVDAEQPELLRTLRCCSLRSDHLRWEALRGDLLDLGYTVVIEHGVEHLRPLAG